MKNITILLISTGKYNQFVQPLLDGIDKNFLHGHRLTVHLFTDAYRFSTQSGRVHVMEHIIPSYRFPEATLYRYKIFHDHKDWLKNYDYLVYLDVDMAIEQEVGDEFIQGDIIGVRHPGFFAEGRGWGSGSVNPESTAYLAPELWKKYFCGGVQGGQADKYLEVSRLLSENIKNDENRGVLAEHNDETHWNKFMNEIIFRDYPDWVINELDASYCNVPSIEQRKNWGIDHLPGRILALDKNHAEVRS